MGSLTLGLGTVGVEHSLGLFGPCIGLHGFGLIGLGLSRLGLSGIVFFRNRSIQTRSFRTRSSRTRSSWTRSLWTRSFRFSLFGLGIFGLGSSGLLGLGFSRFGLPVSLFSDVSDPPSWNKILAFQFWATETRALTSLVGPFDYEKNRFHKIWNSDHSRPVSW